MQVAGGTVAIHFQDERLRGYFLPSLRHLECSVQPKQEQGQRWKQDGSRNTTGTPDLQIFCGLNPFSVGDWLHGQGLEARPHKTFRQGSIRYCSQENGLFWMDEERRQAYFIGNSMDAFEPYRSKPFSRLLCWHLEQKYIPWTHAACVGTERGGVLLPGVGGAGKSTTVAAALLGGLHFLGDDYIPIDPAKGMAHSLYASLMLSQESMERLRQCPNAERLKPEFLGNKDKWCQYLADAFSPQLPASLPLRGILIPQIHSGRDTYLSPASAGEAMNALTSSLQTTWLMGCETAPLLRGFHALTKDLPLGKLNVGSDLRQVAGVIENCIKQWELN